MEEGQNAIAVTADADAVEIQDLVIAVKGPGIFYFDYQASLASGSTAQTSDSLNLLTKDRTEPLFLFLSEPEQVATYVPEGTNELRIRARSRTKVFGSSIILSGFEFVPAEIVIGNTRFPASGGSSSMELAFQSQDIPWSISPNHFRLSITPSDGLGDGNASLNLQPDPEGLEEKRFEVRLGNRTGAPFFLEQALPAWTTVETSLDAYRSDITTTPTSTGPESLLRSQDAFSLDGQHAMRIGLGASPSNPEQIEVAITEPSYVSFFYYQESSSSPRSSFLYAVQKSSGAETLLDASPDQWNRYEILFIPNGANDALQIQQRSFSRNYLDRLQVHPLTEKTDRTLLDEFGGDLPVPAETTLPPNSSLSLRSFNDQPIVSVPELPTGTNAKLHTLIGPQANTLQLLQIRESSIASSYLFTHGVSQISELFANPLLHPLADFDSDNRANAIEFISGDNPLMHSTTPYFIQSPTGLSLELGERPSEWLSPYYAFSSNLESRLSLLKSGSDWSSPLPELEFTLENANSTSFGGQRRLYQITPATGESIPNALFFIQGATFR